MATGSRPSTALETDLPDDLRPSFRTAEGGGLVEAVDLGRLGRLRQTLKSRVFRPEEGVLVGRLDRFPHAGVAKVVGGGPAQASPSHGADVQHDVAMGHVLMDGPSGEPGQPQVLGAEIDVGLLGLGVAQGFFQQGQRGLTPHHFITPIWMFRNRAGAAPWPVWPIWPG